MHVVSVNLIRVLVVGQHLVSPFQQTTECCRFSHFNQLTFSDRVNEHRVHEVELFEVAYGQAILRYQVKIDVRLVQVT